MTTAREIIDKRWGVRTRPITCRILDSLGTTTTLVLPNDPNRLAWLIINLGSGNVYVGLDREVSSARSILIQGYGGFTGMVLDEDYDAVTYEVWGVASNAATPIYTLEVVAY